MDESDLERRLRASGAIEPRDPRRLAAASRVLTQRVLVEHRPRHTRRPRLRAVAIGLGALLVTATTTAFALPPLIDRLGWTPQYSAAFDFTVDDRGPYHCEYRLGVLPGSKGEGPEFREIQHFVETHPWGIGDGVIELDAPAQRYHNDTGVIADYVSAMVVDELEARFPGWESVLDSINQAGQCTPLQSEWPAE